jgi:hypothetical protein
MTFEQFSPFASISSHPLTDLGWKLLIGFRHRLLLISRSSFVRAKSRSFVPARRTSIASRARAPRRGEDRDYRQRRYDRDHGPRRYDDDDE